MLELLRLRLAWLEILRPEVYGTCFGADGGGSWDDGGMAIFVSALVW